MNTLSSFNSSAQKVNVSTHAQGTQVHIAVTEPQSTTPNNSALPAPPDGNSIFWMFVGIAILVRVIVGQPPESRR